MSRRASQHVRASGDTDKERRQAAASLLLSLWTATGRTSRLPASTDVGEILFSAAWHMLRLSYTFDAMTPVEEVTIGSMSEQGKQAVDFLREFTRAGSIVVADSPDAPHERVRCVDPLEVVQGELVRRARMMGVSWKRIGEAAGMSAQGIQQKTQDRKWLLEPTIETDSDDS